MIQRFSEAIFPRIMGAKTSKDGRHFKKNFKEIKGVRTIKLQTFRRDKYENETK